MSDSFLQATSLSVSIPGIPRTDPVDQSRAFGPENVLNISQASQAAKETLALGVGNANVSFKPTQADVSCVEPACDEVKLDNPGCFTRVGLNLCTKCSVKESLPGCSSCKFCLGTLAPCGSGSSPVQARAPTPDPESLSIQERMKAIEMTIKLDGITSSDICVLADGGPFGPLYSPGSDCSVNLVRKTVQRMARRILEEDLSLFDQANFGDCEPVYAASHQRTKNRGNFIYSSNPSCHAGELLNYTDDRNIVSDLIDEVKQ